MQAFELIQAQRRLSYREFGNPSGENILVCLPGILENQSSFDALVPFFKAQNDTRVVTIDLCGRGQSDWLAPTQRYSMQQYSEDLKQFLAHLHATHQRKQRKMHLLGTSMGAILAMHLASDVDLKVHTSSSTI